MIDILKGGETVLGFTCLHFPFAHIDALDFLEVVRDEYQPTSIINLGDEVDNHYISRYDTDPDGMGGGCELDRAVEDLKKLYVLFPEVKCCISNHTVRPYKKAYTSGLPKKWVRNYGEVFDAPAGWIWQPYWIVDGVKYQHDEANGGKFGFVTSAINNRMSSVVGHLHANFGVKYLANEESVIFGAAAGCLIDKEAYAHTYGEKKYPNKPMLGCVIVENSRIRCIPMLLDAEKRWVGVI